MGSLQYSDYQMILDTGSMTWVMLGYASHILLAVMQGWLIGAMLVSGCINVLGVGNSDVLRHLGAVTHVAGWRRRGVGSVQLMLAGGLGGPLLLGSVMAPVVLPGMYWFSLLSALAVVVMLVKVHRRQSLAGASAGRLARPLLIVFALLCVVGSAIERRDNLVLGLQMAFTAKHYRDREIAWQVVSDRQSPKVGDLAPDFRLPSVDGELVSLSQFFGEKPTVLFFGANSCPAFSEGSVALNRLQRQYGERVNFVGVYVREPHPVDEWWLTPSRLLRALHNISKSRAAVDISQPQHQQQRDTVARRAKNTLLNAEMTLLIDGMDNAVNERWTGQPTRIYLLDSQGRVIYNPGMGPYAFNPDYLGIELEKMFSH